jgi:phosphoglycerate dehydrogenase-like enzyme
MIILTPAEIHEELSARVSAIAPDARLIPYLEDLSVAVPEAANAEIILRWVAGKRFERLVLDNPSIRWLHTESAGVDMVLTPAIKARESDLILTDSGPAYGICMGEFVVGWMLAVAHRFDRALAQQREHLWKRIEPQEELFGRTVGIIGLGPIGRGVALRCKAMGMRTVGLRRTAAPVADVDEVRTGADGLAALLAESDWVVIATALTDETRALIGAGEIARMKPTARIVNVARGAVIEETALIDALRSGRIAGACLDVFTTEPLPGDSPFWDLPNVWIAPHSSAGWTAGLRERGLQLFLDNLRRYIAGEPLMEVVEKQRGY